MKTSRAVGSRCSSALKASTKISAPCTSEAVPAYTNSGPVESTRRPSGVNTSVSMPKPSRRVRAEIPRPASRSSIPSCTVMRVEAPLSTQFSKRVRTALTTGGAVVSLTASDHRSAAR